MRGCPARPGYKGRGLTDACAGARRAQIVYGHLDDPETSGLERGVTYLKLRPGARLRTASRRPNGLAWPRFFAAGARRAHARTAPPACRPRGHAGRDGADGRAAGACCGAMRCARPPGRPRRAAALTRVPAWRPLPPVHVVRPAAHRCAVHHPLRPPDRGALLPSAPAVAPLSGYSAAAPQPLQRCERGRRGAWRNTWRCRPRCCGAALAAALPRKRALTAVANPRGSCAHLFGPPRAQATKAGGKKDLAEASDRNKEASPARPRPRRCRVALLPRAHL